MPGLGRALKLLTPLGSIKPRLYDNFDEDQIARDVPDWAGMPARWLKPKEQVAQERQADAEAQQRAQMSAEMEPGTKAIRNLADAEMKMANAA